MKAPRQDAALERLELYVAALSGRPLLLCWHDEPHALAFCDGGALSVPRARAADASLDATLQALLVRQGSLAAGPMQKLIGRPARARGYLAAELARAVRAHGGWLPRDVLEHAALRELPELPLSHASVDDSLARARRHELARTPAAWGVLMPARVLAQQRKQGAGSPLADDGSHAARNQPLPPSDELEESSILAAFRAPVEGTAGLISDALAYDKGYEGAYAHADTRKALAEARAANTASVCLRIGASTGADALTRVFGGSHFLALPDVLGGERALRQMFERAVAQSSRRGVARAHG